MYFNLSSLQHKLNGESKKNRANIDLLSVAKWGKEKEQQYGRAKFLFITQSHEAKGRISKRNISGKHRGKEPKSSKGGRNNMPLSFFYF